jgi:hypothetical protein
VPPLLTIGGGGRERPVCRRRGRGRDRAPAALDRALLGGPSTSPLCGTLSHSAPSHVPATVVRALGWSANILPSQLPAVSAWDSSGATTRTRPDRMRGVPHANGRWSVWVERRRSNGSSMHDSRFSVRVVGMKRRPYVVGFENDSCKTVLRSPHNNRWGGVRVGSPAADAGGQYALAAPIRRS